MTDSASAAVTACRWLQRGDADRALAALRRHAIDGSTVMTSIELAANGLIFERDGDSDSAARCFEQVFELGVPLPALLRTVGRYFKRAGRLDRAYHCFALLQPHSPSAMAEFLQDLPQAAIVRYAPLLVRQRVEGEKANLYALQPVKAALATELGPGGGALAYAELAGHEPGFRLIHATPEDLGLAAERDGVMYEVVAAPREVMMPPPPIFGGTDLPPLETQTRTVFIARLADAVVSSKSNVVVAGDRILLDIQAGEREKVALNLDVDPVLVGPEADTVRAVVGAGAERDPPLERALSLVGVHSANFGHWLIEFLPKLLMWLDRPAFGSVPVLLDAQMPAQHAEAVRMLAGAHQPIVVLEPRQAVRVRELLVAAMPLYMPLGPKPGAGSARDLLAVDGEMFADLWSRACARLGDLDGRSPSPSRIYLSRTDTQHRKVVNRAEVEAWFASQGFAIHNFGELTFREQVRLVRAADVMVGPDGSSTLMSLFARPGTRVGVLSNAHAEDNEWYGLVCRCLGQPVSILTGDLVEENARYRTFSDYRIDVETLPAWLDDLLARD